MKILAVDTSGKEMGMGVFSGEKCLYERYLTADRAYNRHIMPMVDEALKKTGLKPGDIDVFAAALGPGSFTGIRVGMAVMKALAHGSGGKFAGASTLDIIAASAGARGRIWAVLEAGRNEVYAAEYGKTGVRGKGYGIKTKYILLPREKFFSRLKAGDTVAGLSGENIMVELKRKSSKINIAGAAHVEMKDLAGIVRRQKTVKNWIYTVSPVYVRPSEAEVKRKQKAKMEAK